MFKYYTDFWKNYVNFKGTASRTQYWYAYLWNAIIFLLLFSLMLIGFMTVNSLQEPSVPIPVVIAIGIMIIFFISIIIPSISITVRRLRDGGFHWAFIFFNFIPYVGGLIITIFMLLPTKGISRSTEDSSKNSI